MGKNSGMILVGLVITMIIFTILGVAIVRMFSTASMNEVSANLAHKAQYMAESGFRYAASQYRNLLTGEAKDDILTDINTRSTYPLSPYPPGYELKISSYFYKYNNSPTVNAFGTVPTDIASHTGTGKIGIFNLGYLTNVGTYSGYTKAATSIAFTPSGTAWPSVGSRLFPVVSPATGTTQTVTLSPTATVQLSADDLSLFPAKNGSFRIYKDDKIAKYEDLLQYKDLSGTTLTGISRINGTSTGMTIAPTDYIVLQRFINLESTGKAGDDTSNVFASRANSYQIPVEAFPGGGSGNPEDDLGQGKENIFPNAVNLPLANDPKFEVLPGQKNFEAVIQATGTNINDTDNGIANDSALSFKFPNNVYNVHVNINWWRFADLGLGLDFDQAYTVQGGFLSYDAQVKARTWKQLYHVMTGLSFRMNNNNVGAAGNTYYGVSLFYSTIGQLDNNGNYPNWLGTPTTDGTIGALGSPGDATYKLANLPKGTEAVPIMYVVLWKRVGTDSSEDKDEITLLGYQVIPAGTANPSDPTFSGLYYFDWTSIVVRLEETQGLTKTNHFKIVVYDKNTNLLMTFKWPTELEWAAISSITPATANQLLPQGCQAYLRPSKDADGNYIEGCESCDSCTSPNVCGWPEIGVHVLCRCKPGSEAIHR